MSNISSFLPYLTPRRLAHYALLSLLSPVPGVCKNYSKTLIIDTDLFSDVDDAGALLLASTLPDINLLGINVNVNSSYSALAASAIVNHYGHSAVPIGLRRPYENTSFFDTWAYELGEYASKVAYHWSGGSVPWFEVEKTWDPVELYRKLLADAEDGSVTIASIGFFENLSGLLNSTADRHSALDGAALVETKVKELAVMGGGYPSGYEFNFWGDSPLLTAHVSVPVTFLGTEIGEKIFTGARLTVEGPTNDPVRAGYEWYVGYNTTRQSWDPLTVAYACLGLGTWFEYGNEEGYNYVSSNGSNAWIDDPARTNQHYLNLKMDNETVASELEEMFLRGTRA
ncbi:nucleoside hydrolase [Lophiostoma macrostomum CBS 122681]|uniref:Nucleoside hydrolase n=1 Tax=Lophiostoma macrostomum CBS 122681 TaxID=1314788 RepID=A0A6A6SXR3_9PLEO|nr:nucleoside hydrolase [Lophiostoma macrostomum CBS 122681]